MALTSDPTGADIRGKAAAGKLDTANSTTAVIYGKRVTYTPADLHHVANPQDVEQGQFIGVVESEVTPDKTALPPGKHNLYIAKVGNDWHIYAESGGQIVAKPADVEIRSGSPGKTKPQISEGSVCFLIFIVIGFVWFCV